MTATGTLAGTVAIVTGSSSGIGSATARRLAGEGAAVALVARRIRSLVFRSTRRTLRRGLGHRYGASGRVAFGFPPWPTRPALDLDAYAAQRLNTTV